MKLPQAALAPLHAALVTAMLLIAPLSANGQTPVRDVASRAEVGTAVLIGTLRTDDSEPRPIRRATITLNGGGLASGRITATDDEGRFVFAQLPAGQFNITAAKQGYVRAYYGSQRPGRGPGVAVAVPDGQRVTVAMKMLRGAVVAGTVVDENGRPAARAGLQLLQYRTVNGQKTLEGAYGGFGYASTDDRGMYRAYGLAPGAYLVAVTGQSPSNARTVSASDVAWAQQQFTDAGASRAASPTPSAPVMYAPVYYPGTVDAASASLVTVGAGEERTDVNFAIQRVPTARIEGTVVDPEGLPSPNVQLTLLFKTTQPGDFVQSMGVNRPIVTNGKFTVSNIPPGQFLLTARAAARPAAAPANGGIPVAAVPAMWAVADVTVDGRDLSGVTLTLEPMRRLSGRIVFDGGAQPRDVSRLRISADSLQIAGGVVTGAGATINPDGTFSVSGLVPGRYRLIGTGPDPTWTMKSVTRDGRDITDAGMDVAPPGDMTDVIVTFTDRPSEIGGTVLDANSRPTPSYSIVVFSTDRSFWAAKSRRVQAARPASDGTFKIVGLPPGEYFIAALSDYEPTDLGDPAFLAAAEGGAYKLTLADGQRVTQNFRVGGQ